MSEAPIEFKTAGYYSFAVALEKITMHAIDDALEQAALKMHVDPQYMFIPEQSYKALRLEIALGTNICLHGPSTLKFAQHPEMIYINQTTGGIMWMVPLPQAESNVVIFGFITH